ncbi:HNH endonuclease [Paraburkholderia lacunae]|uniref:HNH nuclease domain-containing protein n=1 Tax=Paraburkholderia lacunae TaxID=2211104 RepID=A0A370MYX5_9BURK|nr:HNH endonuclease signature motif containing protein [Paraburkholderia lacunae]RDJ98583.1 hypothetical protein DLM46_33225 [Paraburkholderia lacunae]
MAQDAERENIVYEAERAFGGKRRLVRMKEGADGERHPRLAHGVEVRADGSSRDACSLFWGQLAQGHLYELAISRYVRLGQHSPARVVEWVEAEIAVSGRPGHKHRGTESWPTLGFADSATLLTFLDKVKRIRRGQVPLDSVLAELGVASNTEIKGEPEELPPPAPVLPEDADFLLDEYRARVGKLNSTEALRDAKQRIGQDLLRDHLLTAVGCCQVTGLRVHELLRVSHIRRWANSTDEQRLSLANVLLLAPHLDALFDRGFVTFDDDGSLVFSSLLDTQSQQCLGLASGRLKPSRYTEVS